MYTTTLPQTIADILTHAILFKLAGETPNTAGWAT